MRGEIDVARTHLRPAALWEQRDVEFVLGRPVARLDVAAHEIALGDGERIGYDALLLATGGRARVLSEQKRVDGVHVLRTIDDALAIREHLGQAGGF